MRLLSACCLGWLVLVWAWPSAYLALTVDDAFYYLEIAHNAAAGLGATFDGSEPTDGYHPLWLWLLSGLSWLGGEAPDRMRVALSAQLGLVWLGARWLSGIPSLASLPLWLGVWLLGPYGAKVFVNGQESALQFFLLAASLRLWAGGWRGPASLRPLALGLLAGLCALARLEAALFGLCLAASAAAWGLGDLERERPEQEERERPAPLRRAWLALQLLLGLALVLGPFLAGHYRATGHLAPVSGSLKAASGLAGGGLPPAARAALLVGLVGLVGLLGLAVWRIKGRSGAAAWRALLPLVGYAVGLQAYLWGVRGAWLVGIWYWVPHVLLAGCLLAQYAHVAPGHGRAWVRRGRLAAGGAWLALVGLSWAYRLTPSSYARYEAAARVASWLNRERPGQPSASWDAGIVGAHAAAPVVNLDGLVNSWRYKEQYLDRGRTEQYLSERRVGLAAQYFPVRRLLSGRLRHRGVDFAPWRVEHADCFQLRRATAFWRAEPAAFMVLSRSGPGPALGSSAGQRRALCEEAL